MREALPTFKEPTLTRTSLVVALLLVLGMSIGAAQTFPLTVKAYWNPNPISEGVTGYELTLDGGVPVTVVPATINDTNCPISTYPSGCVMTTASIPSAGQHVFSVVAVNQWGARSLQPATATININTPGQVVWVKIAK